MRTAAETFQALIRPLVGRLRWLLLGLTMDNLVFRREIGLDPFGRLRRRSPIYVAHGLMAGWLILELVLFAVGGWPFLFQSLAASMGAAALGLYPYAAWRAFQNISTARSRGSMNDLWLSGIDPGEVFGGKFYGLLAPLVEVRRYMTLAGVLFVLAFARLFPLPWLPLSVVIWATAVNHAGHSAVVGTLAGLRWGLAGEVRAGDLIRDWRLNPWPDHLLLNLKIGAMLALPLGFLLWLGTLSSVAYLSAFGLMLLMPFYSAVYLRRRQDEQIERLRSQFAGLLRPEVSVRSG